MYEFSEQFSFAVGAIPRNLLIFPRRAVSLENFSRQI